MDEYITYGCCDINLRKEYFLETHYRYDVEFWYVDCEVKKQFGNYEVGTKIAKIMVNMNNVIFVYEKCEKFWEYSYKLLRYEVSLREGKKHRNFLGYKCHFYFNEGYTISSTENGIRINNLRLSSKFRNLKPETSLISFEIDPKANYILKTYNNTYTGKAHFKILLK